jgi:Mrp family chromosome partitioning ATPase
MPSQDAIEEYNGIVAGINSLKLRIQELKVNSGYTEAHPLMLTIRGQIESLYRQRAKLTNEFPQLATLTTAISGTNSSGGGLSELAEIRRLSTRVASLEAQLAKLQTKASEIIEIEPVIASLTTQLALDRTNYQSYVRELELAKMSTQLDAGKQVSIGTVQEPSPPVKNTKKMKKRLGMVFGGICTMGLGLAFLIDFVLDRSIKRSAEIERTLRLPVFQAIPDTAWSSRPRLLWSSARRKNGAHAPGKEANGENQTSSLAVWDPVDQLHPYTEGLRERLMMHFEGNNLSLKRPKLVGVTACARGSGVTTLASGLAASLSRIGTGNVLFVDMNVGQGEAQPFHNGKQISGLTDLFEKDSREDAAVGEKLYVARIPQNDPTRATKVADAQGLAHLMPQINASDYDYIIFDFPPVSQTNSTARLAGYMDLTLLVIEAERTAQQAAVKANALMTDARARVAAVLNKCHKHVPERFSQDL